MVTVVLALAPIMARPLLTLRPSTTVSAPSPSASESRLSMKLLLLSLAPKLSVPLLGV